MFIFAPISKFLKNARKPRMVVFYRQQTILPFHKNVLKSILASLYFEAFLRLLGIVLFYIKLGHFLVEMPKALESSYFADNKLYYLFIKMA